MKAYVDKDTCIGCGLCEGLCPEIFKMEDDGKAIAEDIEITNEFVDATKEAQDQCPVSAIDVQ